MQQAPPRTQWKEELICDYRSPEGPFVTHARGLLIASSLTILKEAGYHERYLKVLPSAWHEQILLTTALSWVPIEAALAHYLACDALGLSDAELSVVGQRVTNRFASTFIGTLSQITRSAGREAPWIALRSLPRVWNRIYLGGSARIIRTGMKDVTGELSGLPLARSRYFRAACFGYLRGVSGLFVRSLHLKPAPPRGTRAESLAISGSWV